MITLPNAVNDKFILVASTNLYPVDPVLLCRSDPARSTRLNFDPINFSVPSLFLSKDSTWIVKIEWDLLDYEFISVSA